MKLSLSSQSMEELDNLLILVESVDTVSYWKDAYSMRTALADLPLCGYAPSVPLDDHYHSHSAQNAVRLAK